MHITMLRMCMNKQGIYSYMYYNTINKINKSLQIRFLCIYIYVYPRNWGMWVDYIHVQFIII